MDACVFIHTNAKQMLGARVAAHALRRATRHDERFEVRILSTADHPFMLEYDRRAYQRIEPEWNDFDRLTDATRMVHNTRRLTQPWKTGLPIDFRPPDRGRSRLAVALARLRRRIFGEYAFLGRYQPHPDPRQEEFFFGLLRECVEAGEVSEAELRREMACRHLRPDALEVLERTPPLPA